MEYYWTLLNSNSNSSSSGTTTHALTSPLNGNFSSTHPWHHPSNWDLAPNFTYTYNTQSTAAVPCPPPSIRSPDPLTCLKLGKRHYFQNDILGDQRQVAAKKTKPYYPVVDEGAPAPRCQVEGCGVTLVNAKDYHRRHKVCETHAKAPSVMLLGIRQRFCQQCSRFHSVGEFDETKRSCRRRLAGHNERRRKISHSNSQDHINSRSALTRSRHTNFLNTTADCALSLLSSTPSSSDLPVRCSAALRELIAENRACRQHTRHCPNQMDDQDCYTTYDYKLGSFIRAAGHVTTTTMDLMQARNSGFGLFHPVIDAEKNSSTSRDDGHGEEAAGCSEFWKSIDF